MANTTISALPSLATMTNSTVIPVDTGTDTFKISGTTLKTYINDASSISFNPLFTDASSTTAGSTVTGYYILVGGLCYFRVYVNFATCTNFGTGQYQITLPFPSIQTMRQAGGTLHAVTANALYHIAGITDTDVSTTVHKLYYSGSTTDLAWKYNTPVAATTVASHFDLCGIYQIA